MRLRYLLLFGFALVVIGCKPKAAADEDATPQNVKVETAVSATKSIHDILSMDGQFSVSEGSAAKLGPVAPGRLKSVLVKEGDRVRKGQLLAFVDMRVQVEQAKSAISAQASAQAMARQSAASLKAAQADRANQVEVAQSALDSAIAQRNSDVRQAELELKKIQVGARPEELAQAKQTVIQARISRQKALVDRDRDAKLAKEGYVSGQQADASAATFELADSAYQQAEAALSLVKSGVRTEERLAAEEKLSSAKTLGDQRVAQARLALKQARDLDLSVEAKAAEAQSAAMNATQKAADAQAALATSATGEIRAPYAGTITHRYLSPGDSADPANPVFEIAANGYAVDFVGQLSTEDAQRVHPGMPVQLGGSGEGRVVSVGVAAAGSGLVPVRVRTLSGNGVPGAFETVQIVLKTLSNVVVVPKDCVVTRDGKSTLFLVVDGKAKLTEVEPGPTDGDLVAILRGVKSGQTVIKVGQYELADGTSVEVEKP